VPALAPAMQALDYSVEGRQVLGVFDWFEARWSRGYLLRRTLTRRECLVSLGTAPRPKWRAWGRLMSRAVQEGRALGTVGGEEPSTVPFLPPPAIAHAPSTAHIRK